LELLIRGNILAIAEKTKPTPGKTTTKISTYLPRLVILAPSLKHKHLGTLRMHMYCSEARRKELLRENGGHGPTNTSSCT